MYMNVERVGVSSQHVIVYYGATLVLICVVLSLLTKKPSVWIQTIIYSWSWNIFWRNKIAEAGCDDPIGSIGRYHSS